jgi:hypothetical protein
MKELTDFLDKYNVQYIVDNGNVIADEIDLSYNKITVLPENLHLIKCTYLRLNDNKIKKLPENFHLIKCDVLDLSWNEISELPDNFHLIKCRNLDLSSNRINNLSNKFYLIKSKYIQLANNRIKKLPKNFHLLKCDGINLAFNYISELPENFHLFICNTIYLDSNDISELPENFHSIKCNFICLSSNSAVLNNDHQYFDIPEITNDYIFCDNILTWITGIKHINEYTVYVGMFDEVVVTKDNKIFAHGTSIRQAISDLLFKLSDRNKNSYINMDKNVQLPINEMIVIYRTITGACAYGVEKFMHDKHFNTTISINEINDIIGNEYGSKTFREFFQF